MQAMKYVNTFKKLSLYINFINTNYSFKYYQAMAKNRKRFTREQIIYSAPRKVFVEKKLSRKGLFLIAKATTKKEKALIWKLYGRNKYRVNPDAVPVKLIKH